MKRLHTINHYYDAQSYALDLTLDSMFQGYYLHLFHTRIGEPAYYTVPTHPDETDIGYVFNILLDPKHELRSETFHA